MTKQEYEELLVEIYEEFLELILEEGIDLKVKHKNGKVYVTPKLPEYGKKGQYQFGKRVKVYEE